MTIKAINRILGEPKPECAVKGHRVHTTSVDSGEGWPEWGRFVRGIGGAFVHFESEEDFDAWRTAQDRLNGSARSGGGDGDGKGARMGGRCVNECGPIGFYAA